MKKILMMSIILISCAPSKKIERNEKSHGIIIQELDSIINKIFIDTSQHPLFKAPISRIDPAKKTSY